MALEFPSLAEADMAETDSEPGEDAWEARDGEEPVEDVGLGGFTHGCGVGDKADREGEDYRDEGSSLAVDIGEDVGGLALFCEGGEGTWCALLYSQYVLLQALSKMTE